MSCGYALNHHWIKDVLAPKVPRWPMASIQALEDFSQPLLMSCSKRSLTRHRSQVRRERSTKKRQLFRGNRERGRRRRRLLSLISRQPLGEGDGCNRQRNAADDIDQIVATKDRRAREHERI